MQEYKLIVFPYRTDHMTDKIYLNWFNLLFIGKCSSAKKDQVNGQIFEDQTQKNFLLFSGHNIHGSILKESAVTEKDQSQMLYFSIAAPRYKLQTWSFTNPWSKL